MENEEKYLKKIAFYYDESGKLKQYPTKRALRLIALERIADSFEAERHYTEKEVNEIIQGCISFPDAALIRRELYQERFIDRKNDGSEYWKEKSE